jgi:hypothetical protein
MKILLISLGMSCLALMLSCRSTEKPETSATKDIPVFNTQDGQGQVLYSDNSVVYKKICSPLPSIPFSRNCAFIDKPLDMSLEKYIKALPFDTGSYARDPNGLQVVTTALNDAITNGQQNVVTRLTQIKSNLEKIAKINEDLEKKSADLTIYEYQDDFSKLLAPFSSGGTSGTPNIPNIEVTSCTYRLIVQDGCELNGGRFSYNKAAWIITILPENGGQFMTMSKAYELIEKDLANGVAKHFEKDTFNRVALIRPTQVGSGVDSSWSYRYKVYVMGSGPSCEVIDKIYSIETSSISCANPQRQ